MTSSSTAGSLAATLKAKQAADQAHTLSEQQKLASALRQQYSDALSGTLSDIEKELQRSRQRLQSLHTKSWLISSGLVLFLLAIICGASWGLTQYLSGQIQTQLQEIEAHTRTLDALNSQTWGISLQRNKEGQRFIVLPKDGLPETGWTVGNRPAIKF